MAQQSGQTEDAAPSSTAESPSPAPEQSASETDAAPAAPKEKQMPAKMREFDNADDYAEACFYDYYDLVVAESMDPNSPLYGMDDTTLIKIAYDDAYDDWYRYH